MSQIEIVDSFDRGPTTGLPEFPNRLDVTLTAADIVARTGLPRSSVFRGLRSLIDKGFVYQDVASKRYALGPRMLQLGMAARRQLASEQLVVLPLVELGSQTNETVTFSLVDTPWRICVYQIESRSELRQFAQVGARYALHLGAAGKVVLAYLPADLSAVVLKHHKVPSLRANEISRELVQIRKAGYATTTGERVAGASSVAAPVFVGGNIFGSVAVAGPTDRIAPMVARHQAAVVRSARQLSDRLSAHEPGLEVNRRSLRLIGIRANTKPLSVGKAPAGRRGRHSKAQLKEIR
jgi:DNA-binding IclR family transcriptional regulator